MNALRIVIEFIIVGGTKLCTAPLMLITLLIIWFIPLAETRNVFIITLMDVWKIDKLVRRKK